MTPFLPSETLVFSVGVLAASDHVVNPWLAGVLALAATVPGRKMAAAERGAGEQGSGDGS